MHPFLPCNPEKWVQQNIETETAGPQMTCWNSRKQYIKKNVPGVCKKYICVRIIILSYRTHQYDHLEEKHMSLDTLFTEIIITSCNKRSTRQKHLLHVNKSNINIYSKSFGNTSARIWNAMQSEFEVNVSISKFKIVFKLYLQGHSL